MTSLSELYSAISETNGSLIKLRYIIQDIENNFQYHVNLIPYLLAARNQMAATRYMYSKLLALYSEAEGSLEEIDRNYVAAQINSFQLNIDGFQGRFKVPALTMEEALLGELSGTITMVDDGDTVWIDDKYEVRFPNVEAQEKGTDRGQIQKQFLEEMVQGKQVTVKFNPENPVDFYGRIVGVVILEDGTNVRDVMVANCMCDVTSKYGKNMFSDVDWMKAISRQCRATVPGEGMLKIYSSPANAAIWVDGTDMEVTSPKPVSLPIGKHFVELRAPGRAARGMHIDILPGEKIHKFPELPKLPVETGFVSIDSPQEGWVVIDGEEYGPTPMNAELSLEEHEIVIRREGYPDYVQTVIPDPQEVIMVAPEDMQP